MRQLKKNYWNLKIILINSFLLLFLSYSIYASEVNFKIEGNTFSDSDAILSLLKDIPKDISEEYTNDIIKVLSNSNLFSDVRVKLINNTYIISVVEFPNIDKLKFKNNKRLEDEELELIASEISLTNFNQQSIELFKSTVNQIN